MYALLDYAHAYEALKGVLWLTLADAMVALSTVPKGTIIGVWDPKTKDMFWGIQVLQDPCRLGYDEGRPVLIPPPPLSRTLGQPG